MSINRAPWNALVDDDGSNTVGSIWNKNAIKNVLLDPIDVALVQVGRVVQTTTLTGLQHDFGLTTPGVDTTLVCNNASLLTLDGIAGGVDGQLLTIVAANARVDLPHQGTGSAAGNRLINQVIGTTPLSTNGNAIYQWQAIANAWRLIAHEQGAWITPPYAASLYTANSGSWTVDAGDVVTHMYRLVGKALHLNLYLGATSVAAALPTELRVALPNGFTCGNSVFGPVLSYYEGGATWSVGYVVMGAGASYLVLRKDPSAGTTWVAATNSTSISAIVTVAIT
jgi:hypothetical protein